MITVYGSSDDLIEIEGAIEEEFSPGDDAILAFSNGVLLRINYDNDGVWRIKPLVCTDKVVITQAPADDENNYSDRAVIEETVFWVALASEWAA
jgi:hypothetical protein